MDIAPGGASRAWTKQLANGSYNSRFPVICVRSPQSIPSPKAMRKMAGVHYCPSVFRDGTAQFWLFLSPPWPFWVTCSRVKCPLLPAWRPSGHRQKSQRLSRGLSPRFLVQNHSIIPLNPGWSGWFRTGFLYSIIIILLSRIIIPYWGGIIQYNG